MQQDQIQAPPTALARRPENPSPVSRAPGPGEVVAPAKLAPAATAAPWARSPRRFILPLVLLAGLGYGAHLAYYWFVEGRFLISTDDAYVGADMAIIAAKVSGHVTEVAVAQNQAVHAGDLLVRIDDGDYKLMVDAAKAKVATQDATIERIGRQVEAQKAVIAQAEAQIGSANAQRQRPRPISNDRHSNSSVRKSSPRRTSAPSNGWNRQRRTALAWLRPLPRPSRSRLPRKPRSPAPR